MNKKTIRNWLSFLPAWVKPSYSQFVVDPNYDPHCNEKDYIEFRKRKTLDNIVQLLEEKGIEWEMFRLPSEDPLQPRSPEIIYRTEGLYLLTEREMAKLIQELETHFSTRY